MLFARIIISFIVFLIILFVLVVLYYGKQKAEKLQQYSRNCNNRERKIHLEILDYDMWRGGVRKPLKKYRQLDQYYDDESNIRYP